MDKNGRKKRLLAWVLTACMAFALLPAPALAGDLPADAHAHDMSVECGQSAPMTFDKALTSVNGALYIGDQAAEKDDDEDRPGYMLPDGNYYLAADLELDGVLQLGSQNNTGPAASASLCLNGHKLTGGQGNAIDIFGGTLNLCDCNGSHGSHDIISPVTKKSLSISGGLITGASEGGILGLQSILGPVSTLNFYGGTIAGNGGADGCTGGVQIRGSSVFNLYGGSIVHNTGGIGNYGGVGGVYVDTNSRFTMSGGTIAHNKGSYGGVLFYGADGGSFTLSGGAIQDNWGTPWAGGIAIVDGSMTISGRPTIAGNVLGEDLATAKPNNLYLGDDCCVTVSPGFAPTEPIGVTTQIAPTASNPVPVTGANSADYSAHFTSDNPLYAIQNSGEGENQVVRLAMAQGDFEGAGTSANPYLIKGYDDLAALAAKVNGGEAFQGKFFKVDDSFNTDSGEVTTAIGKSYQNSFQGSFDGNGKTIELDIDAPDAYNQGLFGYVLNDSGQSTAIQNVTVSGSVAGKDGVGGVAGHTYGDVHLSHCVNTAIITGGQYVGGVAGWLDGSSRMADCANTGEIIGDKYVGGVIGYKPGAATAVTRCYNTGAVKGHKTLVGGVIGSAEGTVSHCYNTGTVTGDSAAVDEGQVGGVTGATVGTVTNCYNTGAVTSASKQVGGVAGHLSSAATVNACVALGMDAEGVSDVGRVAGDTSGTRANNHARDDMKLVVDGVASIPTCADDTDKNGADLKVDGTVPLAEAFAGWDTEIWTIPEGNLQVGCDLPTLKSAPQIPAPTLPGVLVQVTPRDGAPTRYNDLGDALAAAMASPHSTLQLLSDVEGSHTVEDSGGSVALTIDLNGKTWEGTDYDSALTVAGGSVTLTDSAGDGQIDNKLNTYAVKVTAGTFTVSGEKPLTLVGGNGVRVEESGSIRLTNPNAVYHGENSGLFFKGIGTYQITGGTFEGSTSVAIWLSGGTQEGEMTVASALGGLYVTNTSVVIAGGIYSSGLYGLVLNENGSATLKGGTFTSTDMYAVDTSYANDPAPTVGSLLAEGYAYYQDGVEITEGLEGTKLAENGTVTVAPAGEKFYSISGIVKDSVSTPVKGAGVTLKRGNTVFARTVSGDGGAYSFPNVKPGTYNVVAEKGGQTKTILVILTDENQAERDIQFSAEGKNSVLEVKGGTPDVVVGGLDAVAEAQGAENTTVKLTVEQKDAPEGAEEIAAVAPGQELFFLDMSLVKITADTETPMDTTGGTVLEIVVPYDTAKPGVAVFRKHGAEAAKALTRLTGKPDAPTDGTYWAEADAALLHIYASKFSTYAIGYTTGGGSQGGTSGGSSSGGTTSYTITAKAGAGGSISPNGKVSVDRNNSKTFAIKPATGYEIADVLVDGQSVGAVGSYTFEKVTKAHTIEARFRQTEGRAAWNPFTDVKEGDWFFDSVKYVYEQGWMNGTGAATFSPYTSTNRGMIVTILWRMEQEPGSGTAMTFADVPSGSYYHEAVRWGLEQGIVKGYDANTFGPEDIITREQLAAILYRYGQYKGHDVSAAGDLTRFADQPSAWARDAVAWAVGAGILTGKSGTQLDPRGHAARAEAAAMLERFAKLK